MWLRMVRKFPPYSLDALPRGTGKTWDEWDLILTTGMQRKCGVLLTAQYLIDEHRVKPGWAQLIALQYVMKGKPQRLQ
ncbi:MAG: hypothetical protein K8L99_23490 [Anaerolineae bacterium]|nr:hypothetical protein [Anaerolineae bacterium]